MLSKRQRDGLKLMVEGCLTQKDIAAEIKVSEQTICNWKKNDEFMAELNRAVKIKFQSLAPAAVNTHRALLNAKSEMVRYLTAKDILDRSGFLPEENVNINGAEPVTIINNIPRTEVDQGGGDA